MRRRGVLFSQNVNPFSINEYIDTGYSNTSGRTLFADNIGDGAKTLVCLAAGQSNCANHVDTNYTVSSGQVLNLNLYDGSLYLFADSCIGAGGTQGNWLGRLGDKLITAGTFARVIFIPISVGATSVQDWCASGQKLYHRLAAGLLRKRNLLGSIPSNVTSTNIWVQGESDAVAGTSQANYQARWADVLGMTRGLKDTSTWWMPCCSYTVSGNGSNATIRAAQAALRDGTNVLTGPDMDTITDRYDDLHFNATGADSVATLWKNTFAAVY